MCNMDVRKGENIWEGQEANLIVLYRTIGEPLLSAFTYPTWCHREPDRQHVACDRHPSLMAASSTRRWHCLPQVPHPHPAKGKLFVHPLARHSSVSVFSGGEWLITPQI